MQLDRAQILFDEINVDDDEQASQFVVNINGGNRTVPTVVFSDGSTLTNPSLRDVQNRLDSLA
jgi:mycoredoxin